MTKVPRGSELRVGVENLRDLARYAAQVAVLHVGVDIHHAADVVVIHDLHLMSASDTGEVAQDFWIRRCDPDHAAPVGADKARQQVAERHILRFHRVAAGGEFEAGLGKLTDAVGDIRVC